LAVQEVALAEGREEWEVEVERAERVAAVSPLAMERTRAFIANTPSAPEPKILGNVTSLTKSSEHSVNIQ
jgi:hypothetical protein